MSESILITGPAGYVGSHFVEALLLDPVLQRSPLVLLDDLRSGHFEFIETLQAMATELGLPAPAFERVSLLEPEALNSVFLRHRPKAVLHFAALISVAESVEKPELYHLNNVEGSKNLLSSMKAAGTRALVFSSTAAVYGEVGEEFLSKPVPESARLAPINPYGHTKLEMEREILNAGAEWGLRSVIFRYFNAAGASPEGRFGEWHDPETHLIPLLLRAADAGTPLRVYGSDYSTRDGSCVRDYIHVRDLASAHLLGLSKLLSDPTLKSGVFNLGTSQGTSVLEVIAAAEKVLGKKVEFEAHPRRPGDAPVLVADSSRARTHLGWHPHRSQIDLILQDAWAWEQGLRSRNRP